MPNGKVQSWYYDGSSFSPINTFYQVNAWGLDGTRVTGSAYNGTSTTGVTTTVSGGAANYGIVYPGASNTYGYHTRGGILAGYYQASGVNHGFS
jgi:hypothetical protein